VSGANRAPARPPRAEELDELELDHEPGCSAGRLERFTAWAPAGEAVIRVARCIDCGAQALERDGTVRVFGEDGHELVNVHLSFSEPRGTELPSLRPAARAPLGVLLHPLP
jgi:hypothetical protein